MSRKSGCNTLWFGRRRGFLFCVLLAILAPVQAVNLPPRPNIVVVMVDDLDVGLTHRLLGLGVMPNLQSIADQGFEFSNAFVTDSVCGPSRATFLSGLYTHNHGVLTNYPPTGGASALNDTSTIATWMHDGGYYTGYIGKYLNGYGQFDITGDGRVTDADRTYVPPGWDEWRGLIDPGTYRVYDYTVNNNGVVESYGSAVSDYQTDVLSGYVQEFLLRSEQQDETPFFLVVAPLAPHVEIFSGNYPDDYHDIWKWDIRPAPRHDGTLPILVPQPPSYNEPNVGDKPLWLRQHEQLNPEDEQYLANQYRHRAESMLAVDDLLGGLLGFLAGNAELDHTVVFFTSDNGYMHGEHRLSGKSNAYEEAIRVPLYVRLPDMEQGVTIGQDVVNSDLAPTIAEIAGVSTGHEVDGRSIATLFSTPAPADWRRQFLIEHYSYGHSSPLYIPAYAAVRTGPYWSSAGPLTLVSYVSPYQSYEYYDIGFDPYQLYSLHNVPIRQSQISVLDSYIELLKACSGAGCRTLEDEVIDDQ